MKTIKQQGYFIFLILIILTFSFSAQASNEKAGKQNRKTASFHGISVSSGIDLYLTQGNSEDVVIEADPDIIDDIITEVSNGVLHIYMKKKINWVWNEDRAAYVTFDDLTQLDVSAGADVESENAFRLDELKISVSSGADLEIDDLTAESVWLDTSSGSDAEISGNVKNFEASSSSGSDISCSDFVAQICRVSVSSGADAEVHVTESLHASASSGGDVRYKGNPEEKDINESSGGDVIRY